MKRSIKSIRTARSRMEASVTNGGQLQINIYGTIGIDYWTGEGITAQSVGDAIREASPTSILLRINSPGGDSFEGIAIYNVLRASKLPIEARIDGIAASAASVIALAGDTVIMGLGSMFMIHNAWTYAQGNANDLREVADMLDKVSASAGEIYVKRTEQDWETVKAWMDAETWLNAEEAVEYGFATSTVDDEDAESSLALARQFLAHAGFRHVPRQFQQPRQPKTLKEIEAHLATLKLDTGDGDGPCSCQCSSCQSGDCESCSCTEGDCDAQDCGSSSCMCNRDGNANSLYHAKVQLASLGFGC